MEKNALFAALEDQFALRRQSAKVVIVGLGATGYSVARFLHRLEIDFAVIDSRTKPPLIDRLMTDIPDVPVFTGGFDQAAMNVATHLIVSPGIALNEEALVNAAPVGVRIISDIDLFNCAIHQPLVAITGSNGKSTVTTMLGLMGNASGVNTAIGGNLGVPALELLERYADLYVLELSSFQLERSSSLNANVATVLNVSTDHQDRHPGIAEYAAEKKRIFAGDGIMVLNADDALVMAMREAGRKILTFSIYGKADFWLDDATGKLMYDDQQLMDRRDLPLVGKHNVANALAALALGMAAGFDLQSMCRTLQTFTGLDHRMQKIADFRGVEWINDSKATNIGACIAALQGMEQSVILIAGGDAKGADMREMVQAVKAKAKAVVLMGRDARLIEEALAGTVPVYHVASMKEAVNIAAKISEKGDSVLLSPACASQDQYQNYMERGEKFSAAVRELQAC